MRLQTSLRSDRLGGISLLVTVRTGYDDLILLPPLTKIVGRSQLDTRSPEGALVVHDGGWIRAILTRVLDGVPLIKDVEPCTEGCIVAPLGAAYRIVAPHGLKAEIRIRGYTGVHIAEGSLIAWWSYSAHSREMIRAIVHKSVNVI